MRSLERVKGIEPSYEAWEAAVLPLNYTRLRAESKRWTRLFCAATDGQKRASGGTHRWLATDQNWLIGIAMSITCGLKLPRLWAAPVSRSMSYRPALPSTTSAASARWATVTLPRRTL